MQIVKKYGWKGVSIGVGSLAALATQRLLEVLWRTLRGSTPPKVPADRSASFVDALIWAIATGVGAGVARLLGDTNGCGGLGGCSARTAARTCTHGALSGVSRQCQRHMSAMRQDAFCLRPCCMADGDVLCPGRGDFQPSGIWRFGLSTNNLLTNCHV